MQCFFRLLSLLLLLLLFKNVSQQKNSTVDFVGGGWVGVFVYVSNKGECDRMDYDLEINCSIAWCARFRFIFIYRVRVSSKPNINKLHC